MSLTRLIITGSKEDGWQVIASNGDGEVFIGEPFATRKDAESFVRFARAHMAHGVSSVRDIQTLRENS